MRLADPDAIELEYAQQMMAWTLFVERPRAIAQLGLGAAALTKFCHRHWPDADVVAVELEPDRRRRRADDVRAAGRTTRGCRSWSRTPPTSSPMRRTTAASTRCRSTSTTRRRAVRCSSRPTFYAACRACLRSPGMLTVNLFGAHASFGRNARALDAAFDGRVVVLPEVHEGNRVALAFSGPPLAVRVDRDPRARRRRSRARCGCRRRRGSTACAGRAAMRRRRSASDERSRL